MFRSYTLHAAESRNKNPKVLLYGEEENAWIICCIFLKKAFRGSLELKDV
jgi:hypothetical protein